jgi:hypothetical protein
MSNNGIDLPHKPPKTLLMSFEENWNPQFLPAAIKLEDTLAPFFLNNNIEPPKITMLDSMKQLFN